MTKAGPLPLRSQPATDAPGQGGGAAPFPAEADEKERQRLEQWRRLIQACLPFADAASTELPLRRLLRLSLFQVSCGMAAVLLTGTLNRVMIVELGVPAWLVALMVSLPLVFAPLRALIGFKSDTHRSYFGWRRGPYIWFGSLMQFGGLAIMPFALLLLSGQGNGPAWLGQAAAALAFLLVGAGLHTAQTAGLALATDLAPEARRPRVVALLYVMLLVGMLVSAFVLSALLADFNPLRLIQVIQGAAVAAMALNLVAMWKQEAPDLALTAPERERPQFRDAWADFMAGGRAGRLLAAVGLGAAAFSMQDVLLEPYGAQVLGLSVGATTALTGLWALGALGAFLLSAPQLAKGAEPHRLAAFGALIGIFAFVLAVLSAPLASVLLLEIGVFAIGFGGGLFSVGVLIAAMELAGEGKGAGLALGAWGAVQATCAGLGIAVGGALRDLVSELALAGRFGEALALPATGYSFVYHLEIALLFATLIVIGPLARHSVRGRSPAPGGFGLAEFPT